MIKRISLVWKHAKLSDAEFRRLWLGEHIVYAKQLPGLREYIIDFVSDVADGGPNGIATLRFDSGEALDAAFAIPHIKEALLRTREQFAQRVQVMIVDEHTVVPATSEEKRND